LLKSWRIRVERQVFIARSNMHALSCCSVLRLLVAIYALAFQAGLRQPPALHRCRLGKVL
jgi:hypothetical protein